MAEQATQQFLDGHDVTVHRATLARWLGVVASSFDPVFDQGTINIAQFFRGDLDFWKARSMQLEYLLQSGPNTMWQLSNFLRLFDRLVRLYGLVMHWDTGEMAIQGELDYRSILRHFDSTYELLGQFLRIMKEGLSEFTDGIQQYMNQCVARFAQALGELPQLLHYYYQITEVPRELLELAGTYSSWELAQEPLGNTARGVWQDFCEDPWQQTAVRGGKHHRCARHLLVG